VTFQILNEKISPIKWKNQETGGTIENEIEQFSPGKD
jgi:hypothetical protein